MSTKGIFFLIIGVLALTCTSCDLIKQPPVFKSWVAEEIEKVDWSQVDELPMVEPCLIFRSRAMKKECFFSILSDSIYRKLLTKSDFEMYTKIDTVHLIVSITTDSKLLFSTKYAAGISEFEKQKVDSIITTRLVNFPKIIPAKKRGMPVSSQFQIPIVLLPSKLAKD